MCSYFVVNVFLLMSVVRKTHNIKVTFFLINLMYIGPYIIVMVEEWETNLMSLVIKFYFTSFALNMFRTLIHPSSGACDFSLVSPHWSCVLVSMCVGVGLGWYPCSRLKPATLIPPQPSYTETPTHIETRTHDQCGDKTEKSQAPDDGCINVRNMLSIEEVK